MSVINRSRIEVDTRTKVVVDIYTDAKIIKEAAEAWSVTKGQPLFARLGSVWRALTPATKSETVEGEKS